jgi:hypothetical protein
VIVKTDAHDRMDLPTGAPIGKRSHWDRVPNLQRAYDPVVKRIQFLVEKGLTSMMVLFVFLTRCIAPLQQRPHVAWLYTGENDAMGVEHARRMKLG